MDCGDGGMVGGDGWVVVMEGWWVEMDEHSTKRKLQLEINKTKIQNK